jgi:hypothetical protein
MPKQMRHEHKEGIMADLKSELLFEVSADLEPAQEIGTTPHGTRRIVYLRHRRFI